MAQINPTVGALVSNRDKIIDVIKNKQAEHNIILFPELALTGYPQRICSFAKSFNKQLVKT